jgi:hypothetical protein
MSADDDPEPFSAAVAKRRILAALAEGSVSFSGHALEEMAKDEISQDEVVSVLRGGTVEPGEFERGSWRYRVRARRIHVVVAFRPDLAVVVTAWRVKR